ncbi:MAG TPA: multidrug effflux MFS transporter [Rubrivivax sp.]|nr:multidrug effflux MFS transporter [Rubrivivax sp.]
MRPTSVAVSAGSPRVPHHLAALALSLLLGLQPVTTDVYLPALPMLTRALGASMSAAQLTMSALILAFGLGQMFWGPVADRVGRRPVLLTGLLLYTAASIGGALAGSIEALVMWRVLQGAAMAAAIVCARAIVRDLYEPVEGAQVMALALSGLGLIALAGPLVGGTAALWFGWRGALAVVAAVGGLTLAFIAWRLPETLLHKNPHATRPGPLLRAWWDIGRHPVFLAWGLLVGCTYGGLFTILAASSFVYMEVLGLSPTAYGAAMALGSLSYLGSTFVCRRWIKRFGMAGAVRRGARFTLAGGLSVAALAAAEVHTTWAVLVPQCLFLVGHGIHQPCGQAGVVGPFPRHAGAASALAGLLLALIAFAMGRWLGVAMDGSLRPMAYGLAFWALMTCAVAWLLVQRHAR